MHSIQRRGEKRNQYHPIGKDRSVPLPWSEVAAGERSCRVRAHMVGGCWTDMEGGIRRSNNGRAVSTVKPREVERRAGVWRSRRAHESAGHNALRPNLRTSPAACYSVRLRGERTEGGHVGIHTIRHRFSEVAWQQQLELEEAKEGGGGGARRHGRLCTSAALRGAAGGVRAHDDITNLKRWFPFVMILKYRGFDSQFCLRVRELGVIHGLVFLCDVDGCVTWRAGVVLLVAFSMWRGGYYCPSWKCDTRHSPVCF
jgi:hypothetical protein